MPRRKLPPNMTKQAYRTKAGYARTYYYFQYRRGRKQVKLPLGTDYTEALKGYHEHAQKCLGGRDPAAGLATFEAWTEHCLKLTRNKKSWERDWRSCKHLNRYFAKFAIREAAKRSRAMEYRLIREEEGAKPSTVNREMACYRHYLNIAAGDGLIDAIPLVPMASEKSYARRRVVTPEECKRLLDCAPRYLQRYLVCLWETAMRPDEPIRLIWSKVDLEMGLIRLGASDTKEGESKAVPISENLYQVFLELKAEQQRIPNLAGRVFTRKGQPIKSVKGVWENTRKRAKVEDVWLHDFRHTAITRMEAEGVPPGAIMATTGHKTFRMHQRYTHFSEEQILAAYGLASKNEIRKKRDGSPVNQS